MKLINNIVFEYIQEPGIDGVYKSIRDNAAVCYQTDVDKMKLSPKEFTENVILKQAHGRALEFGTVYLKITMDGFEQCYEIQKYIDNPYSKVRTFDNKGKENEDIPCTDNYDVFITTNMRVIMQGDYETEYEAWKNGYDKNWLEDIEKYWCEPTEHHQKRRTFGLVLSRGASDDLRTHITLSSMCESTRWCNYSKGKYGNQLTGIKPYWIDFGTDEDITVTANEYGDIDIIDIDGFLSKNDIEFVTSMTVEEQEYMKNAKLGLQAQQLKRLFPLWGKCELRLCGFEDAWDNFIWRRLDNHADPECVKIAEMIQNLRNA